MGAGPMDSTQIFVPKWFSSNDSRKQMPLDNRPSNNDGVRMSSEIHDSRNVQPTNPSSEYPSLRYSPQPVYTSNYSETQQPPNNAWGQRAHSRSNTTYPPLKIESEQEKSRSPIPIPPGVASSKGFPKSAKLSPARAKPATFQHPDPPKTIPIRKASKEEERKTAPVPITSFVALERKIKPAKKESISTQEEIEKVEEHKPETKKDVVSEPIPISKMSPSKLEKGGMSSSIEREENFMRKLGWTECDEDSDFEITQEEKDAIYKKKEQSLTNKPLSTLRSSIDEPSDDGSDSDSDVL